MALNIGRSLSLNRIVKIMKLNQGGIEIFQDILNSNYGGPH